METKKFLKMSNVEKQVNYLRTFNRNVYNDLREDTFIVVKKDGTAFPVNANDYWEYNYSTGKLEVTDAWKNINSMLDENRLTHLIPQSFYNTLFITAEGGGFSSKNAWDKEYIEEENKYFKKWTGNKVKHYGTLIGEAMNTPGFNFVLKNGMTVLYDSHYWGLDNLPDGTYCEATDGAYDERCFSNSMNIWNEYLGHKKAKEITTTEQAAAVLYRDGSVITYGSDSSGFTDLIQNRLKNIKAIYSSLDSFAAVNKKGGLIVWGEGSEGNIDLLQDKLSKKVKEVFAADHAFAALKKKGKVVTWGKYSETDDILGMRYINGKSVLEGLKKGIKTIYSNSDSFAALDKNGRVYTWGDSVDDPTYSAAKDDLLSGVVKVVGTNDTFAAIKEDGSVVCWGDGAETSEYKFMEPNRNTWVSVKDKLTGGVVDIVANYDAFAALKENGEVVTWGKEYFGGNTLDINYELKKGVEKIYSNQNSFIAIKDEGRAIPWGGGVILNGEMLRMLQSDVVHVLNPFEVEINYNPSWI